MNIHIIEGKALYVPRVIKVDDFGRHSLVICPEDQDIIKRLEEERVDKLETLMVSSNIPDGLMPNRPTWRWDTNENNFTITINWKAEAVALGKVFVFDIGDDEPITDQYMDKQLMKATFKMSFVQETYYFDRDGKTIYGTALRPRKIKLMKLGDFTDYTEGCEDNVQVSEDF